MRARAAGAEERGLPDDGASLYETDFHAWSREQADALRAAARGGNNLALDHENLAEEVEDLGNRLRDELLSRLETIVEHLPKLQFSPAAAPRPGWRSTVLRPRAKVARLLRRNPSLRRAVPELLAEARDIAEPTAVDLEGYGEAEAKAAAAARRHGGAYTEEQVVGDWFPDPPSP